MHGIVFKRLGHAVHILNRDPTGRLESQGAGIGTGEHVGAFLDTYDRVQTPLAVPAKAMQFVDRDAQLVRLWRRSMNLSSWSALYYRLRANFDGMCTEYCPEPPASLSSEGEATYDVGKTVTDVKRADDGTLTVVFDDVSGVSSSVSVDLVVGADGSGSVVRKIFLPSAQRRFAGYVAWRGMVPEGELTDATQTLFAENLTYFQQPGGGHALAYVIPGPAGNLEPGQRTLNYLWYTNHTPAEIDELMTDADGRPHRITLPAGRMRPEVWNTQRQRAAEVLPAPYAEVVQKTVQPFVQNITDVAAVRASFAEGAVLLAGDALAQFRPHAAASTNQAAHSALLLGQVLRGELGLAEWERRCVAYAHVMELFSAAWGNWNQFGVSLTTAWSVLRYLYVAAVQQVTGTSHKWFG